MADQDAVSEIEDPESDQEIALQPYLPPLHQPLPAQPPQEPPWVLFPCTMPPTVYNVRARGYHRLHELPYDVSAARFCGSAGGGWLLLAFRYDPGYALHNLNSGQRVPLPPTFRSPADNDEHLLVVHAAAFSPSTAHNPPALVAAIATVDGRPTAAFWFQGCDAWFTMPGDVDPQFAAMPQDVIYRARDGTFCFVLPNEELVVYRPAPGPDGNQLVLRRWDLVVWERPTLEGDVANTEHTGVIKRYLLEDEQDDGGGRLLMVLRFVYNGLGTDFFRVVELAPYTVPGDPDMNWTWTDVDELDDRMLFLGPGCSRCFKVDPNDDHLVGDMVYFLDESLFPLAEVPRTENGEDSDDTTATSGDMGSVCDNVPDTGKYSLTEMETEEWPLGPPRCDIPPTWWLH